MSNIITAAFDGETFLTTERLWKGDYGQILSIQGLELPEYYEVHFASTKDGSAQIEVGTAAGVTIPNKFLRATGYIYAWLFLHEGENDGETKYQIKIPVENRGIPIDQETPQEKTAVQQAIEALNEEIGRAEAAQTAAEVAQTGAEAAQVAASASAADAAASATDALSSKTAAEAARSAASNYAGQALDAKITAVSAKDAAVSAKTAAETAQGSAETAKTAAQTAQGKAEDAQIAAESAQTLAEAAKDAAVSEAADAYLYRDQASESATAANNAKTAAQNAQGGAEAAQTAAETAEAGAEAAQEAAEDAQEAAEAVLNSIPQDYSSLNDEVSDLKTAYDYAIGLALRGLPDGYTEKQYAESLGNCLVDTGIVFNTHPHVVIDVLSEGNPIFGLWHTTSQRMLGGPGAACYLGSGDAKASAADTENWLHKRCIFEFSETFVKIDGETIATFDASSAGIVQTKTLRLFGSFATSTSGRTSYAFVGTRIYSAKFYKYVNGEETLVFDGVPCVRDSDGEIGIYDLIGNEFHGAQTGRLKAADYESLSNITGRVISLEDALPTKNISVLDTASYTSGYCWNSEAGVGGTAEYNEAESYFAFAPISVIGGEKYRIRILKGNSNKVSAVLAVDDELNIIQNFSTTANTWFDKVITIRDDVTQLLLTTQGNAYVTRVICDKIVPIGEREAYTNTSYEGARLSLLGDSLSAIYGYSTHNWYPSEMSDVHFAEQMWWKIVCNELGMSPLVINAWTGSGVASGIRDSSIIPASDPSRCESLHTEAYNPDVILLAVGTNDYSYMSSNDQFGDWDGTTPLGSESDLSDYVTTDFKRAYATMIARIQRAYPEAFVVAITPWYQGRRTTDTGVAYLNAIGKSIDDYSQAVKEVCKIMHIPCIDGTNVGFNRRNFYPTYAMDSATRPTHMTIAGQKRLGLAITEQLRAIRRFGG